MNIERASPLRLSHVDPRHPTPFSSPSSPSRLSADSAVRHSAAQAEDSCLPQHFPEPYNHSDPGQAMVYHSQRQSVTSSNLRKDSHDVPAVDEVKEGLRRIRDKYAAPASLLTNGSRDSYPRPSVSPAGSGPASPSPSSDLPASPSPSFSYSRSSIMRDAQTADSTTPKANITIVHQGPSRLNGSAQRLAPLSVSAFSDASSDMSDPSPSPALTDSAASCSITGRGGVLGGGGGGRYQSVSGISLTTSLGDGVTEEDVQQVEMFFRSHKSEVTVCHSLANLYFGSANNNSTTPSVPGSSRGSLSPGSASSSTSSDLWEFVTTGIPLLVLDSGEHHRSRQLSIVVAEKGTGFVLWKDVVSHLTCYTCPHANFHTLRISSDNNKLAGLSFDDSKAAATFAAAMMKLTSDPDDELLMLSKKGKKKKKKLEGKKKVKVKPPKKTDISQPCCFQHVTKLERPQVAGMMPLPPNGFPPALGAGVGGSVVTHLSDVIQERLSLSVSRARSQSSDLSDADQHR